jgi:hypothetical protein
VRRVRLEPDNREFLPILVDDPEGEEFQVVATLIRVL